MTTTAMLPAEFPKHFEAAIFDFDGTIANSGPVWTEIDQTFCKRRDIAWSPALSSELASRGFAEGARWIIEHYDLSETPEAICKEWQELAHVLYAAKVTLYPGVQPYIEHLRSAGIKCALATTNSLATLRSLEPRISVEGLFDVVVCGSDLGLSKREPTIYRHTAQLLDATPQRCLVFEDIPQAIASAQAAGMHTCAVCSGDATQDFATLKHAADHAIYSWLDLAD